MTNAQIRRKWDALPYQRSLHWFPGTRDRGPVVRAYIYVESYYSPYAECPTEREAMAAVMAKMEKHK